MNSTVPKPSPNLRKKIVALFALIGFLSTMNSFSMCSQVACYTKTLATRFTTIGLFPRVYPVVLPKVI